MRPQTIVERLDFVAKRIPGLKFTPPTQLQPGDDHPLGCFMSCDMYYIEIKVDQSHQSVKDVIISHSANNAEGISCPVLRKVLVDQDFETFAKHLAGLHSMYQINTNDKKVKQRAYPALTALESDLTILYDHQRWRISNCHDLVHKSPIGVMEPRKGGLPVKLTYFITPFDLVDTTQKGLNHLNVNDIIDKTLGLSATVEIEGSSPHKLQVKSLITQHNSSLPAYAPFNSQNSEKLPAQFVLKLSQPFPMLNTSISQITNEINEPATIKEYLTSIMTNSKESLISLIARQELDLIKGPFCRSVDSLKGVDVDSCDLRKHMYSIKLLDQNHTYHILDHYLEKSEGVYINKIPFTHPTSIPNIIRVLRQQALFNFVIGSCIRRNKIANSGNNKTDYSSKTFQESSIFDVTPVSLNSICISFEHPSRESLATLEIDLRELSCQIYALNKESVCSDDFATKVLQKCWSIPITLRAVLKKCNERRLALLEDSNKRRERELQELLTDTSNTAQQPQPKSHLRYQDTLLQSKFNNLNESKSNTRDLNSIAEFLSSKISNASTSEALEHKNGNTDTVSNRSNLLKKFSCKPKVKQSTASKNQSGNKILSLMLKRQNSTSADDVNLKAPVTKKVKTKNISGNDPNSSKSITNGPTTTKLLTGEIANAAARLANKHVNQGCVGNQNVSVSLIRSPSKSQYHSMSTSQSAITMTGSALTQQQTNPLSSKMSETIALSSTTNNIKSKLQANGTLSGGILNNLSAANKPRKSSIGAVLDRLVGGVTPEQQSSLVSHSLSSDGTTISTSEVGIKNPNHLINKSKSRQPGDQFAIKQGNSGGGLKLTVTKTKPVTASSNAPSSSNVMLSATSGASTLSTQATSNPVLSPPTSSSSSSSSTNVASSNVGTNNSAKLEAAKIIDLGSSTANIK